MLRIHKFKRTYRNLKQTLRSIDSQIIENKTKFKIAFFDHYIGKNLIGRSAFTKFPESKFKYHDVILGTRPNTIDFWACLESYEPDYTFFLTNVLKNMKGTFIDVGGHIGRYTTLMAKREWNVHTFEPVKMNYDAILSNLKLNECEQYAKVYNVGLGNSERFETIYFDSKELGESSMIKQKNQNSENRIQILRFDDFMLNEKFDDLTIVKIDVEGFEREVFEGMMKFIEANKPLLMLELWEDNSTSIIPLLKSLGYKRLHVFWFIEEKHQRYMDVMYHLYNKKTIHYHYE